MATAAQAVMTMIKLGKGSGAVFLSLPYCMKLTYSYTLRFRERVAKFLAH